MRRRLIKAPQDTSTAIQALPLQPTPSADVAPIVVIKRSVGKPTKYEADMPERMLALMENGAAVVEVAAAFNVDSDSIYNWVKDPRKADFAYAFRRGKAASEAWWIRLGLEGMLGKIKDFKHVQWIFCMKARFGWQETQRIEAVTRELADLPTEEIDKRLSNYIDVSNNVVQINQ